MKSEKFLARSSNRWYIWATATAAVIVADVVLHGVTGRTIFLSLLSVTFAGLMFSAERAEDRVIARYQERPPLVGRGYNNAPCDAGRDPQLDRKKPLAFVAGSTGVLSRVAHDW
jgi:hypothetical protein